MSAQRHRTLIWILKFSHYHWANFTERITTWQLFSKCWTANYSTFSSIYPTSMNHELGLNFFLELSLLTVRTLKEEKNGLKIHHNICCFWRHFLKWNICVLLGYCWHSSIVDHLKNGCEYSKMAVREQHEAQHLLRFWKQVVFICSWLECSRSTALL